MIAVDYTGGSSRFCVGSLGKDRDRHYSWNQDNAERLAKALSQLEARFREHQNVIRPTTEDILAGGRLLLMTQAGPLNVLGFIGENQRYEDLFNASSEVGMNIGSLRVLDLEALIAEKKRMGRTKDNAAVEFLEEVLRHRLRQD